ncbi:acyl-CoA-binding domain-containing protein 6 [Selaginella moellendorffii]|uniref:acyl-CoA-binding domain-containing protein 6 n=1 Tax=Selaginella moellendorffii TaxID=88036 RepID=UPI000D1C2E7B|nr:acyl-CoA-binding domain-containing protein 6 [Selaginella moellendorffii]|eukprot:XP_024521607.1 acyl-CoA-binding domain-containing protein 6 [Selaginella moellendorffii]
MRWEEVAKERATGRRIRPGKRWGHTLTAVNNGKLLFLFGGYGKIETSHVHVFDSVTKSWSKPFLKGTLPAPRDSHTCTAVGSKLFVFGGTDGTSPLDELYVLDTTTYTWTKPDTSGDIPAAREGHSAALVGDDLYVFGGCGKKKQGQAREVYYDDLYALSTTSCAWRKVLTSGPRPCSRDSHSMSSFGNKLVLFGGEDVLNTYLADIYILDVGSLEWSRLETRGVKPAPRAGHAAERIGNNLIIFGGFADKRTLFDDVYVLDLLSGEWHKPEVTGNGPSHRFSLASDLIDPERGVVALYGGCNGELEALPEMFFLHTDLVTSTTSNQQQECDGSQQQQQVHEQPEVSFKRDLRVRRNTRQASSSTSSSSSSDSEPSLKRPKLSDGPETKSTARAVQIPSPYSVKPVAEKIFQGKITSVFHYGYTLETRIDGKPFRGVLFSYKPGFTEAVESYLATAKTRPETNERVEDFHEKPSLLGESESVFYPPPPISPRKYRDLLGSSSNPFLNDLAWHST